MGKKIIPLGVEGMKQHLIGVKKTYPDYTKEMIQYIDGDYVISEFIMKETHKGEWLGITPTYKKLSFTEVDIDKVEDGKIIEHGGDVNTFDTLYLRECQKWFNKDCVHIPLFDHHILIQHYGPIIV